MTERLSTFYFILSRHAYFVFVSYVHRNMFNNCYFFHFLQVLNKLVRLCLYQHNPRHFLIWKEAAESHRAQDMLMPDHLWVWQQICHQSLRDISLSTRHNNAVSWLSTFVFLDMLQPKPIIKESLDLPVQGCVIQPITSLIFSFTVVQ